MDKIITFFLLYSWAELDPSQLGVELAVIDQSAKHV
jgi:hypothetical protein